MPGGPRHDEHEQRALTRVKHIGFGEVRSVGQAHERPGEGAFGELRVTVRVDHAHEVERLQATRVAPTPHVHALGLRGPEGTVGVASGHG